MSQSPSWFERRFPFPIPPESLPSVLTRLRGTPARLESLLQTGSAETLTRKVEGTWSAQENAGHLADLEPLWLARVEDYVAGNQQLTATDLQNRKTDEARHNGQPIEQILTSFRAARQKLLERVRGLEGVAFERAIPHPRLRTPMHLADHLYFVAEHDDHHLTRIAVLLRSE